MKITHYLYNAYVIEEGDKKVAIDPGGLFLYFFRMTTLIPKSEWNAITHIFVTHGDPDHYWHADRVAKASGAAVICNETMLSDESGKQLMLGPRSKGLSFDTEMENVHPVSVDETIEVDGVRVTGIRTTHGELILKLGPFSKTFSPGPEERIGWGAIGFEFRLGGRKIVNLGDTLLHTEEWRDIRAPDVLMIPIGGKVVHNTMDEDEALEAVRIMNPETVLPCHYNWPALFKKKYDHTDDLYFKREVERLGSGCIILGNAESITL